MISSLSHCLESNRRSSQQVRSWKLKQTPFHILFFPPCIVHRVARVHRVSPLRDIDLFASGNQETATVPIKRSAIRFDRVVIQPLATKLRPPNRNMYVYCATTSCTPFSSLVSFSPLSLFHPVAGEKNVEGSGICPTDSLSRKILINGVVVCLRVHATIAIIFLFVRSRYANHDSGRKT